MFKITLKTVILLKLVHKTLIILEIHLFLFLMEKSYSEFLQVCFTEEFYLNMDIYIYIYIYEFPWFEACLAEI